MPKFSSASATALEEEGEDFLEDVGRECEDLNLFAELEVDDGTIDFKEVAAGDGAAKQLKEDEDEEDADADEEEAAMHKEVDDDRYDEDLTSMTVSIASFAIVLVCLLNFSSTLSLSPLLPFSYQKSSVSTEVTEDRPYLRVFIQISYGKAEKLERKVSPCFSLLNVTPEEMTIEGTRLGCCFE